MNEIPRFSCACIVAIVLAACSSGNGRSQQVGIPDPPAAPAVSVDAGIKQLIFSWEAVPGATNYLLMENSDGHSGFTQVGDNIPAGTLSVTKHIAVHLHDWANALYVVGACNAGGCTSSLEVNAIDKALDAIGYFKASNSDEGVTGYWEAAWRVGDGFGSAVALSADGLTLAVGAPREDGGSIGINGEQRDNSAFEAGAVYVFRLVGENWSQQAYVKASNAEGGDLYDYLEYGDEFGSSVSLSSDGHTLAVGAQLEDGGSTGVDGDQGDNSAFQAGAVYIFRLVDDEWSQQAYIKASNAEGGERQGSPYGNAREGDQFGSLVSLSGNGDTLAVAALGEDSGATGIDGDQTDNSALGSGAVYVFRYDGTDWSQQAYVKASSTELIRFGQPALSADGDTMTVGGHVFHFDGMEWVQQSCILTLPNGPCAGGHSAISADGDTIAMSQVTTVPIYRYDGTQWSLQENVTFSSAEEVLVNRGGIVLSGDGKFLAVSTHWWEGGMSENPWDDEEAVYVFRSVDDVWTQQTYVQAPNAGGECSYDYQADDEFGSSVSLSSDGRTLTVGASGEDSNATGIGGDQSNETECGSGAVYLY